MQRQPTRPAGRPLLLLLALLAAAAGAAAGQCEGAAARGLPPLPEASPLKCLHMCPGERGWKVLPVLWAPLNVEINCSTSSYTVLTSRSREALVAGGGEPVRWCGLGQLLADPRVCRFKLSPLHDQYLAVDPGDSSGLFSLGSGPSTFTCVVGSSRSLSVAHMMLTLVGALVLFNARRLAMSPTFRLTSGSLMFMSGAVVVLAFVLMRSVPYKRSLAAVFTVSTSSLWALVRWVYGTWLPDAQSVLLSRPFAVYLLVTGLAGLAVTYWLDDAGNVKLNTTIRVTLQLAGLLGVYCGVSDEAVALAAVLLLATSGWLAAIATGLGRAALWLLRWVLHAGSRGGQLAGASARGQRRPGRRQQLLRAAAGSPLSDDEGEGAEPLLSDEEEEAALARSRRRAARRGPPPEQPLDTFPSFEDWVRQYLPRWSGGGGGGGGGGSPVHLRQPPPLSPHVTQRQPDLRAGGSAARGSPLHLRQPPPPSPLLTLAHAAHGAPAAAAARAGAAAASALEPPGGYRFPSSSGPTGGAGAGSPWGRERLAVDLSGGGGGGSSPWSSERLAVDVRRRPVPSPPEVDEAPAPAAAAAGDVSPLVAMGKILNPETGRPILMNKAKFQDLVAQGYTPDLRNGILIPPAGAPAAAWAGVAGGGRQAGRPAPPTPPRQRRPRAAAAHSPAP